METTFYGQVGAKQQLNDSEQNKMTSREAIEGLSVPLILGAMIVQIKIKQTQYYS
jgi:hypothetical protein